ncbi:anti-sigma factor family protein [Erythrobacter litoralis]|uniref:Zinc-finger domain-containing protein n=1 Tax=Erythrobacter litoralis (strain HTCC2594) TaxID=314225 RepID=Q2NC88_ERYLH|nr:hypothetical protein [Erythrobacter litoralis]ABC62703.1 hypothetical protein ELI_03055 [Erythrobacter litoralis HTCC2594]
MSVTDQQIAAYADGELTGDAKAQVEAAVAADPTLAAKVESHRALKNKLGAHFAPILDQTVPSQMTDLLAGAKDTAGDGISDSSSAEVVSFAAERQKRGLAPMMRTWGPIATGAIAASLVLAVFQPWQSGPALEGYADTQLAEALDTQLVATQERDAATRVLLSFEAGDGSLCRAYRSGETGGIACRDDTGWKIERELGLGDAQSTEFRQAGSEADLLSAAQEMSFGGALDAEAEEAARERGWR